MKRVIINWQQVEALCQIMCTADEVAHIMGCTRRTLQVRCQKEQHMNWEKYFEKYSAGGRMSIRRDLFSESKEHNVAASIFLAKNYLGMGDVQKIDVTVNRAEELSDAELAIIARGKPSKRSDGTIAPPPVQVSPN